MNFPFSGVGSNQKKLKFLSIITPYQRDKITFPPSTLFLASLIEATPKYHRRFAFPCEISSRQNRATWVFWRSAFRQRHQPFLASFSPSIKFRSLVGNTPNLSVFVSLWTCEYIYKPTISFRVSKYRGFQTQLPWYQEK